MRIAVFEDAASAGFSPIALTRPVFELRCGQWSVRERICRQWNTTEWGAFLRPWLAETYREEHPQARVNDFVWLSQGPTLLVNGRWLGSVNSLDGWDPSCVGMIGGTIVCLELDPLEAQLLTVETWDDPLQKIAGLRRPVQVSGVVAERPWDLVAQNPSQLADDFDCLSRTVTHADFGPQVAVLGPVDRVHVHESAAIEPFVVLDARRGPISIDADAIIQPFTRIEGPCHIGAGSQLFGAHVRGGTTIGPVCRVGGEIEASILHGYVNKYHDGFLGHSYVGEWCNLGALTTSSDLKSDYSCIAVPLAGEMIDTGATKVGCFLGDHTKTALGSLMNAGSSVGVMCIVLPGGRLLPKHVPSFANVWHGELTEGWELSRSLEMARAAMSRRNRPLTRAAERLYAHLWEATRTERDVALERWGEHALARVA